MNITELSNLISKRRSVFPKMYSDQKVADKHIIQILENANWAPNHKNTEPWRFHIITGDALWDLGDCLASHYKKDTPDHLFKEEKYKKQKSNPQKASHVIVICMSRDPKESVPEWEEIAAVACAVQNMWLSCTALKIGSYWSTPNSESSIREFLNLADNEKYLGLFYIGYPKIDVLELPASRGSIKEKVTWRGRV